MTNDESKGDGTSQPSVFYSRRATVPQYGRMPSDGGDWDGTGSPQFVDLGVSGLTPMEDRPQGAALLQYCANHSRPPESPGRVWIGCHTDLGRSLDVIHDCLDALAGYGWRVRIVGGGSLPFGSGGEGEGVAGEDR